MNDKVEKIKSLVFEGRALDRYLLSRGIDPRFVTADQKVSHAKSGQFQKWLKDRQFEEFESEDEVIEEQTPQEKFKAGLKKSGYDPDKGAKRLTDLIAKQKKDREEHEKQYGHLYAKEATDYSLVKGQSSNPYNKDVKLSNGYVTKVAKQPKGEYERSVDKYLKKKYNKEEVDSVEESVLKTVKRAVQGWGHDPIGVGSKPKDIVKRNKELSPETSKKILSHLDDAKPHTPAGLQKKVLQRNLKNEEVESLEEEHLVHVSDGSKYGNEPDAKDTEHVIAGIKKHGGEYDGASDKGAYFKFKSKSDAESFKNHVDRCPNRSCHADLHEDVNENHIAIAMGKEMDDEGSMTLNQLDQMQRGIDMVRNYVGKDMKKQLPSWVQSKITLATDYIDTVGNYLSTTNEENYVLTKESFEDEHGISDKKKQSSKSARIIKSIYKKKNMKEDIYDHEKDDKSTVVYGKKPKISNIDDKAGMGENKPEAAAVMSGGTTLTGQKRDVVEIDPMMRKRPGQPDPTKK